MTAVLPATEPSSLIDQFKQLEFNHRHLPTDANSQPKQPEKKKLSEEEKRKKIFETGYEPSLEWWTRNQAEYVKPADAKDDPLPAGFPEKVQPASLWDGQELINHPERFLYKFTDEDVSLLNGAYDHFTSLSLPNNKIDRNTFPIPVESELFKALAHATQEIKTGLGFRVLRGLPVDDWDRKKQIVVFAGIAAYIGSRRIKQGTQNIVHLRVRPAAIKVSQRTCINQKPMTNSSLLFHNDGSAGIVGLITLGVAEKGGLSQLSSVAATYNDLAANRRDILREITKDNWVNKQFPEGDHDPTLTSAGKPLWFSVNGNVISNYSRRPYFGFYEVDAVVPPLPEEKHLALDAIHFTAEKYRLDLNLEKGDLEFFNNLTVFHARDASEDSEKNQRHLLRVWLENKDQELPSELEALYERLNAGKATEWPLEAWSSVDPFVKIGDAKEEAGDGVY
ncbi:taurine catabolism dioxygenase TauD [Kwoniella heveanensis CBS 569]|nr:taurine catabolism dioxygenase TauD [Kwoniella heveanensis CBS 569]